MQLARALRLDPAPSSLLYSGRATGDEGIAFVGAGGKTTAMFQLARELQTSASGPRSVILTATSHLGAWQIPLADRHIAAESSEEIGEIPEGITLVTGILDGDRAQPVNSSVLSWLRAEAKKRGVPLLIEADGSRELPLKAPAAHEPPIPDFAETVIVVAGLDGIGKPLTDEFVFRAGQFREICGVEKGEAITPEMLTRLLPHPEGGLKNIPPGARRVALLNQADTPELQSIGGKIARGLLDRFDAVIVGALQPTFDLPPSSLNLQTFERIAGIVLAAGQATRFGRPKQLLDWKGKPFVRQVAETALGAGLQPVVVVTGAHAEAVESAVRDLDVKIVRNENWQSGQAGSIVSGVKSLPGNIGGSLFLLADQPQIGADVMRALAAKHSQGLPAILAPLVRGERRANPVLFDRVTFPDLLALTGDAGGRALFGRHQVGYLPWHDESLLLDVDTPEDYENLVKSK